ncbi:MAG TPA: BTAD domain-containing putative transcriptional regulator [Dermatophilaceae bacterium]|nr:BTAD domain-containing putative transcriptional regulator [Dermatophilaceae bacterium]
MLSVSVLGTVEVVRDGVRLDVPAGKTSELLARLALAAGSHVRADALIEDLWSTPTERNTLQSKVSQLRRALGDRDLVVGSQDGYVLGIDPAAVDAVRVVQLAAQATQARAAGDAATALDRAREGLALFRGDVLVDVGGWAAPHRTRLEHVRLGLVEDAMAARVELGAGAEVVGELETLVEQHPLREGLWTSLITALYRAGRQAEALAAYRTVRRMLLDELGIEPGQALRLLGRLVLQQSPSLDTGGRPQATGVPGNLPVPVAPMVGRDQDLEALVSAMGKHRLVTVVGTAGVGKTRLAVEAGRGLTAPGGVWLVRLDTIDTGAGLPQVVAETLHVPGGEQALRERLAGAGTVLLLDNCEHVVEPAGALARSLLDAVPQLRVLATSQLPLGLEDEHVHPLEPLSQDQSVTLFALRARQLRRGIVMDCDTVAAVVEVCRSLDGLPLAIELAASRVRSMSVRDIARHLDDRFVLLRDPTSSRSERRRALAGAIAWSYELLFPDDQRALWALSCFAGDAGLDATEHVLVALGVPRTAVLDTIGRLVDRSLTSVEDTEGGAVRYRLLDSIQAFAAARMAESGEAPTAASAHAAWYAATAAWCAEHVRGDRQPECLVIARTERANVDVALAWCAAHDPSLGLRIVNGFGWTWVVLGDGSAGAARIRQALTPLAPARERATALLLAGWLEASAGNVALAEADLDSAADLTTGLDDPVIVADVERHRAFLAIQQGRPDRVLSHAAAALATYRRLDLPWHTAAGLLLSAYGSLMLGDTAAATRNATEAVGLLRPIGDSWGMVHAEAMLGGIAQAEHRYDDAARALARAADESAILGFRGQAALHRATLARVQQRVADPAAVASFAQAIQDALSVGDGRLAATARLHLARMLRGTGKGADAVALLEENERWYRSAGGGDYALLTRCVLAAQRDDDQTLRSVLADARATANLEVQVFALDALARLAARSGDRDTAVALLAESDRLADAVSHLVDASDRIDAAAAREFG